jgi:phospho-N-acetylmuramoyl-pentapeptide-transferase
VIALIVAAGFAMVFTLVLTPSFARAFRRANLGQFVRADTPTTHQVKRGTPSMGGVVFIVGATLAYFVGKVVSSFVGLTITPIEITPAAMLVLGLMVGCAAVGFLDDFLKVRKQNSLGLAGWYKIALVTVAAALFGWIALTIRDSSGVAPASTSISFLRDIPGLDLAVAFGPIVGALVTIAWIVLITLGSTNSVNLTDGLDGLAAGASIFAIGAYIIIGFWQFNQSCQRLLPGDDNFAQCYVVSDPLDIATVAAAIVGSLIGFLWWNTSPAQIHMGDTGSFGLGGAVAALAVVSRTELLLVLIGGLFIVSTVSVVMQRTYFKITKRRYGKGRRIFRSSPLHHHFELVGWAEVTIVVRFWIIAGLSVGLGVGIFYLEWLSL